MHALRFAVGRYGHWFVLASLFLLVTLALVGEIMQGAVVGPAFIRFHMSDFCAPAYSCLIMLILSSLSSRNGTLRTHYGKHNAAIALTLMSIVSTIYWCYDEMYIDSSTDPIDIAAFILGGLVSVALALCLLWSAYEQKRSQQIATKLLW